MLSSYLKRACQILEEYIRYKMDFQNSHFCFVWWLGMLDRTVTVETECCSRHNVFSRLDTRRDF